MCCSTVDNDPPTAFYKRAAQSPRRLRISLAARQDPSILHRAKLYSTLWLNNFRDKLLWSIFFFEPLSRNDRALRKRAAQSTRRFRTPLAARKIIRCFIVLNVFLTLWLFHFRESIVRSFLFLCIPCSQIIIHFRDPVVRSFFFFACPARKLSSWTAYDPIFVALTTWP